MKLVVFVLNKEDLLEQVLEAYAEVGLPAGPFWTRKGWVAFLIKSNHGKGISERKRKTAVQADIARKRIIGKKRRDDRGTTTEVLYAISE
jgi:hypothetical protein